MYISSYEASYDLRRTGPRNTSLVRARTEEPRCGYRYGTSSYRYELVPVQSTKGFGHQRLWSKAKHQRLWSKAPNRTRQVFVCIIVRGRCSYVSPDIPRHSRTSGSRGPVFASRHLRKQVFRNTCEKKLKKQAHTTIRARTVGTP